MSKEEVLDLQKALNGFTKKFLRGVGPILEDGVEGTATNRRIMTAKFYLGYGKRDGSVKPLFLNRLVDPHSTKFSTPAMIERAEKRREKQRDLASAPAPRKGVGKFEGVTVAAWIIPHLQKSKKNGWRGTVTSGFRTPEHSEQVCRQVCGHPTCPGRCAGKTSNHSKFHEPEGAIDVSDFENFGRIQRKIGSPLKNDLPNDRIHFSASGH